MMATMRFFFLRYLVFSSLFHWNHAFIPNTIVRVPSSSNVRFNVVGRAQVLVPTSHNSRSCVVLNSALGSSISLTSTLTSILQSQRSWKILLGLVSATVVWLFRRQWLWPNSSPDPAFSEPLPPGGLGCPLFGHNILQGSKQQGPETFYWKQSKKLNHKPIWKFYSFGAPCISVVGADLVTQLQSLEFSKMESMVNGTANPYPVFVSDNLMFERDKKKHRFLRSLVGSAMTPTALQGAMPTLQSIAERYVDKVVTAKEDFVEMESICSEYTSEIIQSQILGIDIANKDDQDKFMRELHTWINSMYSLWVNTGILTRWTKAYQARQYLRRQIEQQMERIRETPNSSTLSKMMQAVDESDGSTKLTDQQVVENALLLVAAGMETSSSTLTLLMMLLSMHPSVWKKLKEEVRESFPPSSTSISYEKLQELPYLDAVVKEALRIGPVTGGFPRRTKETMVVDGFQIPKGWMVFGNYRLSHYLDPVTKKKGDPNDASHMDVRTGFLPERWLDPETTPSQFLAFGAGPR